MQVYFRKWGGVGGGEVEKVVGKGSLGIKKYRACRVRY